MKKVLNDLFDYSGFKIFQYEEGFKFSLDSLLLAEFVKFHKNDRNVLDLCTGNAVIPLVLSTKTSIPIIGVEIQSEIAQLAIDSVSYNQKEEQIQIICDNVKYLEQYFPGNKFDIVTCNPPYFRYHNAFFVNNEKMKQIARHEVEITLEEIISIGFKFLENKGNFYLVHIPERLQEILFLMEKHCLRVKDIYFIYPKEGEKSFLVLFRAIKNGKIGLKVHEPIFLDKLTTYQNIFEEVM